MQTLTTRMLLGCILEPDKLLKNLKNIYLVCTDFWIKQASLFRCRNQNAT